MSYVHDTTNSFPAQTANCRSNITGSYLLAMNETCEKS